MDRRSFLQLAGAAALSVVVPELWTPPTKLVTVAEALKQEFRVSAPADHILEIFLCGKGLHSEVATFDVIRPDGEKLLALALNTYGGIIRWVAAPGEELPCPLQFVYSGNMTVNLIGLREGQVSSFSVIEPEPDLGTSSPLVIPLTPAWIEHPALAQGRVPDVFRKAFGI